MPVRFLIFGIGLKAVDQAEWDSGFTIRAIEGTIENCRQKIKDTVSGVDIDFDADEMYTEAATERGGDPDIRYYADGRIVPKRVPEGEMDTPGLLYDKVVIVKMPQGTIEFENVDAVVATITPGPSNAEEIAEEGNNNGSDNDNDNEESVEEVAEEIAEGDNNNDGDGDNGNNNGVDNGNSNWNSNYIDNWNSNDGDSNNYYNGPVPTVSAPVAPKSGRRGSRGGRRRTRRNRKTHRRARRQTRHHRS